MGTRRGGAGGGGGATLIGNTILRLGFAEVLPGCTVGTTVGTTERFDTCFAVAAGLAEALVLTFMSFDLALTGDSFRLAAVLVATVFLAKALVSLPAAFELTDVLGVVFADLIIPVFPLAADRTDDFGVEAVLGFDAGRNFACVRVSAILVFAVFALVFTIVLGRLESVSLIRFPF